MKSAEPAAEILEARAFLRSKIIERAIQEGAPLTPLEIDFLDSDHLPNEREINDRFNKQHDFQEYIERLGGLLRRARDNDAGSDPDAHAKYEKLALSLETSDEDLVLFSIAVIGLADPKGRLFGLPHWAITLFVLFLMGVVGYYSARWQGLNFWGLFR